MTRIWLIRHGAVCTTKPHRFIGQTDLVLSDEGREQCRALGAFLRNSNISRILSSPLLRCRQSTAILADSLHCPVAYHDALREIDLGQWEGMSVTEVKERYPGAYEARGRDMAHFRPPGGESFTDLYLRARPVLQSCLQANVEDVALVTHAGVIRVLLCHFLGMPLKNLFRLQQAYGCYNCLQRTESGRLQVVCCNGRPDHCA